MTGALGTVLLPEDSKLSVVNGLITPTVFSRANLAFSSILKTFSSCDFISCILSKMTASTPSLLSSSIVSLLLFISPQVKITRPKFFAHVIISTCCSSWSE
ncbi:hypothetical protein NP493_108g02006 [Ridgeia piscesae]|uniref:Uncharacterized protein n=1 Tax=Ridgeia piscesae TaxID=27915 RepID=A0AAD9P724_RIDPI|nr:hypothetical protein NP493_108g02006 [Ridgeia piscesae]